MVMLGMVVLALSISFLPALGCGQYDHDIYPVQSRGCYRQNLVLPVENLTVQQHGEYGFTQDDYNLIKKRLNAAILAVTRFQSSRDQYTQESDFLKILITHTNYYCAAKWDDSKKKEITNILDGYLGIKALVDMVLGNYLSWGYVQAPVTLPSLNALAKSANINFQWLYYVWNNPSNEDIRKSDEFIYRERQHVLKLLRDDSCYADAVFESQGQRALFEKNVLNSLVYYNGDCQSASAILKLYKTLNFLREGQTIKKVLDA